MTVSIIIPVWNLWKMTASCLVSLAMTSPMENVEVIVVDNGSTDETATHLETFGASLFGDRFHVARPGMNLGFAKGCNLGAARATGDLLFFLNNDTKARQGWFEPLVGALNAKRTGAVGPLLFYPDGSLQHCGIAFPPLSTVLHLYEFFPGNHPLLRAHRPLQAITGAALLLPAPVFREIGGFCEDYVNGFEDIDLCCRLTSSGHRLAIAPESGFEHHVSQTPGRFDHDNANGRVLVEKWGSYLKPDLHILGRLDGYELVLGPDLSAWLETGREENGRLAAESDGSPECLRERLREEPLWRPGWSLLADAHIARGEEDLAYAAIRDGLRYFAPPELVDRLRKLDGVSANNEPPAEKDKLIARARDGRRDAWRRDDKILANLFDQWLARNTTS